MLFPKPFPKWNLDKHLGKYDIPPFETSMYSLESDRMRDYKYNKHNYRCRDFSSSEPCVVSLGCSHVFGFGMPNDDDRFSDIFAAKLAHHRGVHHDAYNLAMPGKSNDYMARMADICTRNLNVQVLLVVFTDMQRREHLVSIGDEPRVMDFQPHYWDNKNSLRYVHPDLVEPIECVYKLMGPHIDTINFLNNYRLIKSSMGDTPWLFSIAAMGTNLQRMNSVVDFLDKDRYVGIFEFVDHAYDDFHPGPASHALIADKFFTRYMELQK